MAKFPWNQKIVTWIDFTKYFQIRFFFPFFPLVWSDSKTVKIGTLSTLTSKVAIISLLAEKFRENIKTVATAEAGHFIISGWSRSQSTPGCLEAVGRILGGGAKQWLSRWCYWSEWFSWDCNCWGSNWPPPIHRNKGWLENFSYKIVTNQIEN